MAIKLVDDTKLTAIGTSIRTTGGTQALLTLDEMPTAIEALGGGGGGGFDFTQLTGGIQIKQADNCYSEYDIDVSGLDASSFTNMASMFNYCTYLRNLINSYSLNAPSLKDCSYMFLGCSHLTYVDFGSLDTSNVNNYNLMFYNCSSLTSVNLANLSTENRHPTGNNMFSGCSALTDIIWATKRQTVQPLLYDPSQYSITSTMNFYVPDALVADYKAATNWSTIASQIHSINDLPSAVATLYAGHY